MRFIHKDSDKKAEEQKVSSAAPTDSSPVYWTAASFYGRDHT